MTMTPTVKANSTNISHNSNPNDGKATLNSIKQHTYNNNVFRPSHLSL